MSFAIVAEFPLGTYRAHQADGRLDLLPSPVRLHAALLSAAGQGVRAESDGARLRPSPIDREALAWLEGHPPDALEIPAMLPTDGGAQAYRAKGFFGVREHQLVFATRVDALSSVAVGAPIAWLWDDDPPRMVSEALAALCGEVSHLGTAEAPVSMRTGSARATHRLDPAATAFSSAGVVLEVPRPGRTSALVAAHERGVGPVPPRRHDGWGKSEEAAVYPVERAAIARARYIPIAERVPDAPWPTVVLLAVDTPIAPERVVGWAVALHRALVSLIGDGAPALVTGRYEPGVAKPANRLAIQYVSAAIPASPVADAAGAFALLVPNGADPADLATLDRALHALDQIRLSARLAARVTAPPRVLAGDTFWRPAPVGSERVWVTVPAAIPESRPVRGRPWTIGDAALLSVGLALRERFARPSGRSAWYGALVDGVRLAGAEVLEAHKLNSAAGDRFVHHVRPEVAVQPFRAALRLGGLAGDRTVLAIGQSRHLGGGLLTPLDIPAGVIPRRNSSLGVS